MILITILIMIPTCMGTILIMILIYDPMMMVTEMMILILILIPLIWAILVMMRGVQ